MNLRRSVSQLLLPGTALFAFVWAVARACVQSITIDEADTYLAWVARPNPSHWEAASNNHVLNSLLMRLFTSVFGVSHLTVRAPALLGAAIYIAAIYLLCVEADARTAIAVAAVCVPGIQPVHLRPHGSGARLCARAWLSDGGAGDRRVPQGRTGHLRGLFDLHRAFFRRQLLLRLRRCGGDAGDPDLGLRPHAGDPGTCPVAGRVRAAGAARVGVFERPGSASLAQGPARIMARTRWARPSARWRRPRSTSPIRKSSTRFCWRWIEQAASTCFRCCWRSPRGSGFAGGTQSPSRCSRSWPRRWRRTGWRSSSFTCCCRATARRSGSSRCSRSPSARPPPIAAR